MDKELTYEEGIQRLPDVIKQMGFTELRPGQKAPIDHIMNGDDTICILATGGGKTAIFTIPALARNWRMIVFSPLIALMRDQEQSLNRKGIKAACINSGQDEESNRSALEDWNRGHLQVLYIAPERLEKENFINVVNMSPPDMVVVDEAHCISQWATTFRSAYLKCGEFVAKYNPKVVVAVTATATDEIVADIRSKLRIEEAVLCQNYVPRTNLKLSSEVVDEESAVFRKTLATVRSVKGPCIVYCPTVKDVASYASFLEQAGESVTVYHGQLNPSLKAINQDEFMAGRKRICVATNAFGMGIDKPDIECIVHTGPPKSMEAVQQEVGRAARDGRDAKCKMFMSMHGARMQEFFWNRENPDSRTVKMAYSLLKDICDSDGIAKITCEELCERIGSDCGTNVLSFLEARGCVKRTEASAKVYTFKDPGAELDSFPKTLKQLVELIRTYGIQSGEEEGCKLYKIDLSFLVNKLGVAESTVKAKINQLRKDHKLDNAPPYRGKVTQLLKEPTAEDISAADIRRNDEWGKIEAVRNYILCPDKDKHAFIQKYFELS